MTMIYNRCVEKTVYKIVYAIFSIMETFQNTHGGKKNGCWSFSFTFWWLALFTTFQKGCVVSVLFFYQCHLSFSCDSKHWKRVMEVFNLLKITKLLKKVYIPSGDCTPFIFFKKIFVVQSITYVPFSS